MRSMRQQDLDLPPGGFLSPKVGPELLRTICDSGSNEREDFMKILNQFSLIFLLVAFGCSGDLPNDSVVGDDSQAINDQVILAKHDNTGLLNVIKTKKAPIIDGKEDLLWLKYSTSNRILTWNEYIEKKRDLSANFRAMWDNENLYLFITVWDAF